MLISEPIPGKGYEIILKPVLPILKLNECARPSSLFFLGVEGRKVVLSLPCFTKDTEDSGSRDWVHY